MNGPVNQQEFAKEIHTFNLPPQHHKETHRHPVPPSHTFVKFKLLALSHR